MVTTDTSLRAIVGALEARGFAARGAFHPEPSDGVPPSRDGRLVRTLVLAGNAGPAMWRSFVRSRERGPDPLDGWCARELGAIARAIAATLFLPSEGPPYLPFQRWALRAEPVHRSPLGILIHPRYGLWHGYRGALGLAERLELPPPEQAPSPCDSCRERPCLSACPVAAFAPGGYDVAACISHIEGPNGTDCMDSGCRARRACPVGREFMFEPEQAHHHMLAFRQANSGRR